MLTDTFGRSFSYLRLSVTDVCNFSCDYCLPNGYQSTSNRDFLSLEEIEHVIKTFAQLGTRKIRITGGEPALRKDLADIISIAANTQGIEKVALTTNGHKLSTLLPDWLAAGLTALNVSIDSLDPRLFSTITGHHKLPEILKGIELAIALGVHTIKINCVLLKTLNSHQLDYFFDWVKHTPITIRFIELMQTGDNPSFFAKEHYSGEQLKQKMLANGWQQRTRSLSAGPALEFEHPDYSGRIGLIMPYSKNFCQSCNRLRISALGKLHLCLFTEQGHDIRSYLNPDKQHLLPAYLTSLLSDKKSSHFLHDKIVGATNNFSIIGG